MNDFLGRVNDEKGFLEKILSKVPGFKGYIDSQNRRDADKLLRETIASHFESLWQRISSLQSKIVASGEIEKVNELEAASLKIRQFIDRIRTGAYGYAGFFDAVKINQEELDAIYQYDLQLLTLEDEVGHAVDEVESAHGTDGFASAIQNINTLSQKCINDFEMRKEVIMKNVNQSLTIPPTSSSGS